MLELRGFAHDELPLDDETWRGLAGAADILASRSARLGVRFLLRAPSPYD